MAERLQSKKIGEATTNYRLRDWIFSRQRYWGEPIPFLKDKNGNVLRALRDDELPLTFPKLKVTSLLATDNRRWQAFKTGFSVKKTERLRTSKLTPCRALQVRAGISCVTATHLIKTHPTTWKKQNTGCQLTFTSVEPPWVTFCIHAFGQKCCLTPVFALLMNRSKNWFTKGSSTVSEPGCVEIERQRRQPRRFDCAIRCRHPACLLNVYGPTDTNKRMG